MKSKTLNLLESIQQSLTESTIDNFFFNEGLEKAKEITEREGCLTCCDLVSKEVATAAAHHSINCEPVELRVFTRRDSGTSHTAILYNNFGDLYIVDYTQKQFFSSNSPEDTKCNIVKPIFNKYRDSHDGTHYNGGLFSNNKFYHDGKEIMPSMFDDINDFIRDFNDGVIETDDDNSAIIYLYSV